jgi:hypothetical protein
MKLFAINYSNAEINRAAKYLIRWRKGEEDRTDQAKFESEFYKVAAFRATHAYPLRIVATLLHQHAVLVDPTANV